MFSSTKRFVKVYESLSFVKNDDENSGKNPSKNLCGKYSQNFFDPAKQSATDALKASSKRVIPKTTGDLVDNKIADKIKTFQKLHSRRIKKQLQIIMIKKYVKKEKYLQKKDKKCLMI